MQQSQQFRAMCQVCLLGFTTEEWDNRHSDADGEDVHESCCETCKTDQVIHSSVPSKDWMRQGAHALCTCGAYRCTVLIERGELKPL